MSPSSPPTRLAAAAPRDPWRELEEAERDLRQRLHEDLARIRIRLKIFDPDQLAAGIGGLHLLPENAPFSARLAIAARLVAELPGHAGITPEWNWLNGWALDRWGLGKLDDPLEDLFCDELAFTDGPYLVLPSNFGDDYLPTKHLLRVLFGKADKALPALLDDELRALADCVLRLSDAMARRGGLRRGIGDKVRQRREVLVPSRTRMNQLARAVVFTHAELRDEVHPEAMSHFAPLMHRPPWQGSDEALTHNGLASTPLRATAEGLIVAFPRQLLSALRHRLLFRVSASQARKAVALALHRTLADEVEIAAMRMGWLPGEARAARITRGAVVSRRQYQFDRDKIANVPIVTDALENYPQDDVNPAWPGDGLFALIDRDLRGFARRCPDDVLSISLTQSIGRHIAIGKAYGAEGRHRWLSLGIDDFRVISVLESADPLALWKFASACDDISRAMEVRAWDVLSLYESHRRLQGGLHALIRRAFDRPTSLILQPGSGSTLKLEMTERIDPHWERFPDPPILVEVARSYRDAGVPIFEPVFGQRPSRVVHVQGGPIWIQGPENLQIETDAYDLHDGLCDVIAYWLWQFDSALGATEANPSPRLVEVFVPDVSDWGRDQHFVVNGAIVHCEGVGNGARVELRPGAATRCSGPDNAGEREIMRALLQVLLVDGSVGEQLGRLVDLIMPLGPKRRIPRADGRLNLHHRGLPPMRGLQEFDELALDRELGAYLLDQLHLRPGPLAADQRTIVLNRAVDWCFQRLKERVAGLTPNMLDVLILYHERLIYEDYVSRNSVESEVRCWSTPAEVEARLRVSMPRFAGLLAGSRFLIEYVAARPPAGTRAPSLAVYDELLALSHRIFQLGMSSDAINYGVADQLIVLDRQGFLSFHATTDSARVLRAAGQAFAHDAVQLAMLPGDPAGDDERADQSDRMYGPAWQQLNHAFEEAEGFSVEDVALSLNALFDAVADSKSEVLRLSFASAVDAIARAQAWPPERARMLIKFLSLEPRPDFLRPPSGGKNDVLPWIYHRSWSYVRRPLVRIGDEIVFGERHVLTAKMHLFRLCREGRLWRRAGTELDRALNELRRLDGRTFNDYVAGRFRPPRFRVDTRLTKIGGHRLQRSDAEPIGDIDVLVADTEYRLLCSIDTKDHGQGRNPREIANEIKALFVDTASARSMITAHLERDVWLRRHVKDALRHLRLDPAESDHWRVASLLVFDEVLASAARRSPIELITINELEHRLGQGGPLIRATNRVSREGGVQRSSRR